MTEQNPIVVGIGASAGGIPALEGFFREFPAETGMAFVIVTHLNPNRESLLHEVIGRFAPLPVRIAHDGERVLPDTVYVMPENAWLSMEKGCLHLNEIDPTQRERRPIDTFLSALAEDQAENAVGIIMSGGDSDGTLGVKAIKEHGGITMAQVHDGSGPRNPEMPNSAISSGLIDFALPVEEMPEKLMQIRKSHDLLQGIVDTDRDKKAKAHLARMHEEIAKLLRSHSGHDFSGYKSKTFLRRVARRMQVLHVESMESYLDRLREDPAEVMALFRDLLINVTGFFRDPEAFEALKEQVIPHLFEGRGAEDTVRIWVPGSATGEEVYSIAILLQEHMDGLDVAPRIQIFATDIDEPALAVARVARYPAPLLNGLSQERRDRFFRRDGASYVLSRQIRDMCAFSPHSVISDPPFSRMDLVSCRNLLIYFGYELQNQAIPTFHYALKPGGYLFLGGSESIGHHSDLFATVDKKHRIFRKRTHGTARPRLPIKYPDRMREEAQGYGDRARDAAASGLHLRQRVESQVLERHAPAHVVVRGEGDIVYYASRTGRYLQAPRGAPSRQLLDMVRPDLRIEVRAALKQAIETGRPAERDGIIEDRGVEEAIRVTVEPLDAHDGSEPLFLVLFATMGPVEKIDDATEAGGDAEKLARMELELRDMRDRLQSTVEEYETALEELKASNEELVSVNEEAQSTNEELEASKEEMQSMNEELTTINAELNDKIEQLDHANTDLKNLYKATQIATIFLDGQLVIRNFTPAASSFFNLRESDIGRPLTELASVLDYPELNDHIRTVFETGEMVEHRLAVNGDGAHFLVRLIPYRGRDENIAGVVITFVDITNLSKAEEQHRLLISELKHRVKNMLSVVISIINITRKNAGSSEAFAETLIGRLQGMSRSYELLSREAWADVSIRELIGQEVGAYGGGRVETDGPDVKLKPQQALSLGMVIHELATNAAKYGALSGEAGCVSIGWRVADHELQLEWRERDGPAVAPPEHNGFGFVLIEGQIRHQLEGQVETSFEPEGFTLKLSFPFPEDDAG